MSEQNVYFDPSEFFEIKSDELRVAEIVPFDCFIYLEINGKIVHWLKAGTTFSYERKVKLKKLGRNQLLVINYQKTEYLKYTASKGEDGNVELKRNFLSSVAGVRLNQNENQPFTVFGSGRANYAEKFKTLPTYSQPPTPKLRVDADFLNVVIKSTQDVFQEWFQVPITFRAPTKRTLNSKSELQIDVASVVELTSQTIRGKAGLCFPSETYRYMLNQVTNGAYADLTSELYAGCGEFMHIIYESSRPQLIGLGYLIDRAVPTLVVGNDLSIPHIIPDLGFSIVFECAGGSFQFEIGIKTGG